MEVDHIVSLTIFVVIYILFSFNKFKVCIGNVS